MSDFVQSVKDFETTIAFHIFAACLWKCVAANVCWNQSAAMLANA